MHRFTSTRVSTGDVENNALTESTTEAQVNVAIAGKTVNVDLAEVTEVQLRGIHQYIRACATGLDTSSIETAISAII